MPVVYIPVLRDEIAKIIEKDPQIRSLALKEARSKFEEIETDFYRAFDEHDVTKELKSAKGESISGAITGPPGANLFSYIGFRQSPIPALRKLLKEKIKFESKSGRVVKQTKGLSFAVDVEIPTNEELYEKTPYPDKWEPGKSWLYGIEHYIAGVSHYLTRSAFRRGNRSVAMEKSRSGQAIQIRGEVEHPAVFSPVSYITSLLSNFRSRFRGKGGRFV